MADLAPAYLSGPESRSPPIIQQIWGNIGDILVTKIILVSVVLQVYNFKKLFSDS